MLRRSGWFATLLFSALGMVMGAAHVLELPQKMGYRPDLYAAVNTTLYRYFALAGAVFWIAAILSASVLTYVVRKRPVFRTTLTATLCLALSVVLWIALVLPVNTVVSQALHAAPATVPAVWMDLRSRWEYGHAASFAAWLLGFVLLVYSAVHEMATDSVAVPAADAGRNAEAARTQVKRPRSPA